jgi:hypothetical protein
MSGELSLGEAQAALIELQVRSCACCTAMQ